MSCVLHIKGVSLDVDAFLSKSKLRPYKIFYKGEPRLKTKPNGEKLLSSGVAILVSNAEFDNLKLQITDTIKFIKRNKEKLLHIQNTKGIEFAYLDFGIKLRIDGDTVIFQSDFLPNNLIRLAGEIGLGLELSMYQ